MVPLPNGFFRGLQLRGPILTTKNLSPEKALAPPSSLAGRLPRVALASLLLLVVVSVVWLRL